MTHEQYIETRDYTREVVRYEILNGLEDEPSYLTTLAEAVDLLREALFDMYTLSNAPKEVDHKARAVLALTAPKEATDE